jgi:hypothetical protein
MSIITPWAATTAAETSDAARPAILPAVVFIVVEIVLVAEAVLVILLKELDVRNPAAAPIAILLSVALLANLGLVCSLAAAITGDAVRHWKRERARELSGWFALFSDDPGLGSADGDLAPVGVDAPACGVLERCSPAGLTGLVPLMATGPRPAIRASAIPTSR